MTPAEALTRRIVDEIPELAAAMGFDGEDAAYGFVGNKTEITKQIGNAVPVNTACALVKALAQ